ncbi:oligosaccharide repeat unit polymerase, partial [Patescibacteria group bacterium]
FWVFIVFNEINTREKIRKLLWCSVITAFVISIYGIFQHQDLWVNIFAWTQDPSERVFTTIGHSNHTAAYLGMNLMILFGLFVSEKSSKKKMLLMLGFAVMAVTLLMTASRGGVVAIFIALLIWFLFSLRDKQFSKKVKKLKKTILFTIAILFMTVIVFRGPIGNLAVVERTISTVEFVQQGNVPDRVSWWFSTWEMIADKPVLGHGLSTYRDVYNQYRRVDYKLPDDAQDHITPESAHMEYLNTWALQGTVGLLAYLLMIGFALYYGFRFIKNSKNEQDKQITGALIASILVYLIQVLMSFGVITTLFMLYTFIGLIISYSKIDDKTREFKPHLVLRILGLVIALAVFVVGSYCSVRVLAAEYFVKNANVNAANNNFEVAMEDYEKAIELMPYTSHYYEGYADYLFETGIRMPDGSQATFLIDAFGLYSEALDLNPSIPYVHVNKGLVASRLAVLYEEDDPEKYELFKGEALKEHKAAVSFSRNNPVYHYKYGIQLMFFEESLNEPIEQFQRVLKIRDPYKDTQVLLDGLVEQSSNGTF